MKQEEIIKRKHKYSIFQTNDGRWRTTVTEDGKRKQISSSSREELVNKLCEYYQSESLTIREVFEQWIERRKKLAQVTNSTIARSQTDFKRFCSEIADMPISKTDVDFFVTFLEDSISDHNLTAKRFSNLKCMIKSVLNFAVRIHQIEFTGIDVVNTFSVMCQPRFRRVHIDEEMDVFSEMETERIISYLLDSDDQADLCILLLFATGMRVGEAVALKHSDFGKDCIRVCRTETQYYLDGGHYREVVDRTKTAAGTRTIVVPSSYEWLMEKIKRQNFGQEWVFMSRYNKRMSRHAVAHELERICIKLDMPVRTPHKIRKTYCSILLDNGVDESMIRQQVGHNCILTTEQFYHRNRKSIARKKEILDSITDFKIC